MPPRLLLSPLRVGRLELRNRVVSTAHGAFLDFYRPGEPGDRYIAYQERRARGGCGLIILQPVQVHRTSQALGHHVYDADDLRPKLSRLASALHRHGVPVLIQLMHFGAAFRSDASGDLEPLWSFDHFPSATGAETAHAMTGQEIEEVIAGFARTAELAVECGLDGVELHAAHGYLLQQSFSPWANRRQDEWGEPLRFIDELSARVRAAIGADRVMGVRLSSDDWLRREAGGLGAEGMRDIARALAATGRFDLINTSAGSRAGHYARAIGSYRHPPGELLPLTAGIRDVAGGVPVIGAGRIATPELAEEALAGGACDLVAMTRAQIADPDLVAKIRAGRAARIRPCVAANQGCVDRMVAGLPITCFHNPDVGREHRRGDLEPAARPRRVLVVGGGPAGLKAAELAARRGHRTILAERDGELGGRLRLAALCGPPRELLDAVAWVATELERLDVDVRTGTEVGAAMLAAEAPEAVVLATGARPAPGALPASGGAVPVLSLDEALTADLSGDRVLVVDQLGTIDVAMVAERVAEAGAAVTLVTPMPALCANVGFTQVGDQLRRLYRLGCVLEASTAFIGLEDGEAITRHVHSGSRSHRPFDAVVAGVAGSPELGLRAAVEETGARLLLAGDAVAPRSAMHAFREGDDAGRAI